MAKVVHITEKTAKSRLVYALEDDFDWYVTAHRWTGTFTDAGAAVITAGTTVLAVSPSDGTVADNDESYIATTNAVVPMADNRPFYLEGLIQFTEGNVDDANVAFGLASSVAANLIVDDGAGMRASGTVIAIYKIDGGTNWICVSRNGATATVSTSTTTAGGAAQQKLSIEVIESDSLSCTIVFKVDDQILRDSTTQAYIRHTFLFSGSANCQVFAGMKNGAITTAELLNLDWIGLNLHR